MTFANTQTGTTGSCPNIPTNQRVTGAGTWALTPRGPGEYDVVAEYESGARSAGRLDVRTREAQLREEGPSPSGGTRQLLSTLRFNETFERTVGTGETTLTTPAQARCVITWDLTTTFATPLIPPGLR